MPRYRVAHIRQQDVNLVIVPLDGSFGNRTDAEKHAVVTDLQSRATAARLAGTVVPVWDGGGGRMRFIAPVSWHPFFKSLDMRRVHASMNKELSW